MAQFFGGRSRFIIIMQKMSYFCALLVGLLFVYLAYRYIGQIIKFKSAPILSSIMLSIIYFPIIFLAFREKRKYDRLGDNFKKGGKGEGAIYYELLKLPDNYFVFQDVKFPKKDFNIDFVVVGPTGIFAVEVKSHDGLIGFNGDELMRNGRVFNEGDPLKQTMQETLSLNTYILEQTRTDYFVIPLLVFSSNKADVKFGTNMIKNVYVIQKRFLNNLILNNKGYLSSENIVSIKNILTRLVGNK